MAFTKKLRHTVSNSLNILSPGKFSEFERVMARIAPAEFMTTGNHMITLRNADPREARALLQLIMQTYKESPYLTTRAHEFTSSPRSISGWIDSHLQGPGRLMLVAEYGNALIGMLDFKNSSRQRLRHVGEFGLSVAQHWQGLGVGRALMNSLLDWAARSPVIEKIELQVLEGNSAAVGLYDSLGFTEEGRRREAVKYIGNDIPCISIRYPNFPYMDVILMGKFVKVSTDGGDR